MHERLAEVATEVVAAVHRRVDHVGSDVRDALDAILRVLAADYGRPPATEPTGPAEATGPTERRDPLARIGWAFGLDDTSLRLLAVAAAPDFDANLARAFELLSGPGSDGRASVGLALELCRIPSLSGPHWVGPSSPLRAHGLLAVVGDGPLPRRTVATSERITSFLAEVATPSATLTRASDVVGPASGPPADRLAELTEGGVGLVWLRSSAGLDAAGSAVAGFGQVGLSTLVVDLRRTSDPGALLAEATLEAALYHSALVVAGIDDPTELGPAWVDTLTRAPAQVAVIVTTVPRFLEPGVAAVVDVPAPRPSSDDLPVAVFDDLVLPQAPLDELRRLVRWVEARDEVLVRGPIHGLGGKGTGLTALLTGPPGTGKTLAAQVVAAELGRELRQIDLSAVVDKYVGETSKHLDRIFADAESAHVVLFFDEADALFGQRSAVRDAHDRYANQEISFLLQRMENFDGVTLLATNLHGNVDPAFSRRLHFVIHFPEPDPHTRRRLWERHLQNAGDLDADDPVDVVRLAEQVELTGGEIRNIVLGAAYDAATERRTVGMHHVWAATLREFQKLGRRPPALEISPRA
ncbi:ATP-binding protein [Nocardioides sp. YIM 152315]|uniref:ATP-binding protein n=1 Tax=Nocardioides sp. YIM 152315 TaxID=3031760 RepID=UPI0023D9FB2F|nr:ATP-binding protein [Nocardioides sp. YIM 152315]MDF1603126.1 ATP-binding protein [Nocardioides sp. YIM 152315]